MSPMGPDNIVAEEHVDTSVAPVDERRFSDQRSLEELIDKLDAWELDPMKEELLCLDAFRALRKTPQITDGFSARERAPGKRALRQVRVRMNIMSLEADFLSRLLTRGLNSGGRNFFVRGRG